MHLTRVYIRFFKSFNYDYERKYSSSAKPRPWELLDGTWYPYIRLDLEPSITTIVGANESGKSHLLDSIEKLITGRNIDRSDFCRYSQFFSVEHGQRRFPDFGGEFEIVSDNDIKVLSDNFDLTLDIGSRFKLFRANGQKPVFYIHEHGDPIEITDDAKLIAILPSVFRLNANIPLPASIPLYALAQDAPKASGSRQSRGTLLEQLLGRHWSSEAEFAQAAPGFYKLIADGSLEPDDIRAKQYDLARALLFKVAQIDPTTFSDLSKAIDSERDGYANGIIQKVNSALAIHLNFPRWWAQDREFRLMVSPREHELVFTIRDRTGTDYSFSERSSGLKYFLSYYVQLLAHTAPSIDQHEILLMDEPDAYLSSQGQQDLLRILEEFATPEDTSRHDQVVYVTHSPFLINRNAGERIRVLDKGVTDEGTRVVRDVARNHYEPLRSSFGAFVAETSFIGGSNLFVEGLADQVLIAGISSHLRRCGAAKIDTLDLNEVTIVPAGSASSVPYLIYLARGRDVVRPPCVALLDSDDAGNDAAKALRRGGARQKQLLSNEYIIQVGAWASTEQRLSVPSNVRVMELEDLISLPVATHAVRMYADRVLGIPKAEVDAFLDEEITAKLASHPGSLFDATQAAFTERFGEDWHIEKVGFAKEVVAAVERDPDSLGAEQTKDNFSLLIERLAHLLRQANRAENDRRVSNRLARTIASFLSDYPSPTTRERGKLLVEEIEASIDDSDLGDRLKLQIDKLRREFELDEGLTKPIDRFDEFREKVAALRYEERFGNQETETDDEHPSGVVPHGATAHDAGAKSEQDASNSSI